MLRANTYECRTCSIRFQLIKLPPSQDSARFCPYCGHATIEPHQIIFC